MKCFVLAFVLALGVFENTFAQEKKAITGGIVNGKATYLPKPDYPQEARDFCAAGKVEIEVLIGEDGNVIEAKAISGDELLHALAVEAAKKAKFRTEHFPVKVQGTIVYNFVSKQKCIDLARSVNKKALTIPKPHIVNLNRPKHLQVKHGRSVTVQIVIDESGKVIYAKAISGHSMLRGGCEKSAKKARFPPTFINSGPLKVKALLVYKFNPNGEIEF